MIPFKIKMAFKLNEPNYNNRIYTTEEFTKSVEKFFEKEELHIGELFDGPYRFEKRSFAPVDFVSASHTISNVYLCEDDSILVEGETLPTREGSYLASLINKDEVVLIPRGIGEIVADENGSFKVLNYSLLTFDFVIKESFNNSFSEQEQPENEVLKEIINEENETNKKDENDQGTNVEEGIL